MGAQTENSELIKRTFGKYLAMSILITLSATLGMMIDNVIAGNLLGSGAVAAIGMSRGAPASLKRARWPCAPGRWATATPIG